MKTTVTQLNNYLSSLIGTDTVLSDLCVEGETCNVRYSNEYLFFTLKDATSHLDCFSYGKNVVGLENGVKVLAYGNVNYLQKQGKISFYVSKTELSTELGEEYKKLLLVKEKLTKMGCFDEAHKRTVPQSNRTIGVVTSKDGAVISDIKSVVARRDPSVSIYLYSVKVQGENASEEIAKGIDFFSKSNVDVVIVARGGGSNEDLSAFNTEQVAISVFSCEKPIVSAVGHGIDYTFCDFASDKRAVTPSEAAEYVTENVSASINVVFDKLSRMKYAIEQRIRALESQIVSALQTANASNPMNILQKGYGYIKKGAKTVKSINDVKTEDSVKVKLRDGAFVAVVKDVKAD